MLREGRFLLVLAAALHPSSVVPFPYSCEKGKAERKEIWRLWCPLRKSCPNSHHPLKVFPAPFPQEAPLGDFQPARRAGGFPGTPKRKLMLLCLCVVERWGRKRVERTGGAVKANGEMQGRESRPDHA